MNDWGQQVTTPVIRGNTGQRRASASGGSPRTTTTRPTPAPTTPGMPSIQGTPNMGQMNRAQGFLGGNMQMPNMPGSPWGNMPDMPRPQFQWPAGIDLSNMMRFARTPAGQQVLQQLLQQFRGM